MARIVSTTQEQITLVLDACQARKFPLPYVGSTDCGAELCDVSPFVFLCLTCKIVKGSGSVR
jgi:hypothetical protein